MNIFDKIRLIPKQIKTKQNVKLKKSEKLEKEITREEKVQQLLTFPQTSQRTQEWYKARSIRITASEAASVLKKNERTYNEYIKEYKLYANKVPSLYSEKQKMELFMTNSQKLKEIIKEENEYYQKNKSKIIELDNKCSNPYSSITEFYLKKLNLNGGFKGNIATRWGNKYEQVASDIYSRLCNETVLEFGLIENPTIPWLGASPDGITTSGRMLEIKCPFRRKPTGIPPFYYWVQVQLQLQCCLKLDYCDFFECEMSEYIKNDSDFMDQILLPGQEKGIIISTKYNNDYDSCYYYYPPIDITDPLDLIHWSDNKIKEIKAAITIQQRYRKKKNYDYMNYLYIDKVYWKLEKYTLTTIKRNDIWFNNILPDLKQAHDNMLLLKKLHELDEDIEKTIRFYIENPQENFENMKEVFEDILKEFEKMKKSKDRKNKKKNLLICNNN